MQTLKALYIDQLQDLYSANKQSLRVTEKLVSTAKNAELREALERGVVGIKEGMAALESLIKSHDASPTGEFCKGMEGLVKEVHAHALEADIKDDDVLDASIIAQYQRMTHYALAGYGTTVAFAKRLGLGEEAVILQKCLDDTYGGDAVMTRIAEGQVNRAAAA
jgi:ferritin-like metal-binding protein YciE